MVTRWIFIFIVLFVHQPGFSITINLPAKVSCEINGEDADENKSIPVTVSIVRDQDQKVDESSFALASKPLKVQFLENVRPSAQGLIPTNSAQSLVVSK